MSMVSALSFADDDHGMWGRARAGLPSHDQYARATHISAAVTRKFPNRHVALAGYAPNNSLQDPINSSHLNAPSSVPTTYLEHDGMASPTTAKNFGASPSPKSETRTELHRALTLHVTDPAKVVARRTGASADTVDHHRQGNVPQSWSQLIAYCRAYPAFGLEVLELMGIDIGADRNAYVMFLQLQKQVRGG